MGDRFSTSMVTFAVAAAVISTRHPGLGPSSDGCRYGTEDAVGRA
jgi:hypothetical protein